MDTCGHVCARGTSRQPSPTKRGTDLQAVGDPSRRRQLHSQLPGRPLALGRQSRAVLPAPFPALRSGFFFIKQNHLWGDLSYGKDYLTLPGGPALHTAQPADPAWVAAGAQPEGGQDTGRSQPRHERTRSRQGHQGVTGSRATHD